MTGRAKGRGDGTVWGVFGSVSHQPRESDRSSNKDRSKSSQGEREAEQRAKNNDNNNNEEEEEGRRGRGNGGGMVYLSVKGLEEVRAGRWTAEGV